MTNMTDIQKLYAPFNITKIRKKIAYCNNNVIPLLIERGISWDMTTERIIFCGRRFSMMNIDNGKAEEFIKEFDKRSQLILDYWKDARFD